MYLVYLSNVLDVIVNNIRIINSIKARFINWNYVICFVAIILVFGMLYTGSWVAEELKNTYIDDDELSMLIGLISVVWLLSLFGSVLLRKLILSKLPYILPN